MVKRLDIEQVGCFVEENSNCKLLSNEYQHNRQKLRFICGCGNPFETNFNKFKDDNKRQCNECGKELNNKPKRLTVEYIKTFVEENSDCVLLSEEYKNNHTKLKMLCGCGDTFYVPFDNFAYNETRQCLTCANQKRIEQKVLTIEEVRNFVNENTNCTLLSSEYVNAHQKLEFKCECGKLFYRTLNGFKNSIFRLCMDCSKRHSKGEIKVKEFLESKGIEFIQEYTFDECKYKKKLPFDFYIPAENICIEYDGEFHFEKKVPIGDYKLQQKRDAIKTKFCKDNHIKLIRIPYYEFNKIEEILEDAI